MIIGFAGYRSNSKVPCFLGPIKLAYAVLYDFTHISYDRSCDLISYIVIFVTLISTNMEFLIPFMAAIPMALVFTEESALRMFYGTGYARQQVELQIESEPTL